MKTKTNKRWVLMNKTTFKQGHSYSTRAAARARKAASQLIYDTVNLVAVR